MHTQFDLKHLGARLKALDVLMLMLARRRIDIARLVEQYKHDNNQPIVRSDIERKRIDEARAWAGTHGLDPDFAAAVEYLFINESCKQQLIQLEGRLPGAPVQPTADEQYALLKASLLDLAKIWATSYDKAYDTGYFATRDYLRFEKEIILREVDALGLSGPGHNEAFIDLGCATGKVTLDLASRFTFSTAYDLSPQMITRAEIKSRDLGLQASVGFRVRDIEEGIPHKNDYAAFVVMNLGTASDIRGIKTVLAEIMRVLRPGGRFLLSFYNQEALLYRWDLPWPAGLAASINPYKHCLEVHADKKTFEVYARAYSVAEVERLLGEAGVTGAQIVTYPAISSILPPEILEDQPDLQEAIAAIDQSLSTTNMGAYIIATGQKPA